MPSVGGSTPSAAACSWNVPSPLFIINWVGPVIEGIAHPRRDEHVLVAVIVKVSRGHAPGPQRLEPRRDGGLGEFPLDRKSTRLNSSHGYISYAVFCLKKKKRNKRRINRSEVT